MKPELPLHRIDITALAERIDESETTVKLALKGGDRDSFCGLGQIRSVKDAERFFKRTENPVRRAEIALRGIGFCKSLEELEGFEAFVQVNEFANPNPVQSTSLDFRAAYTTRFRALWPDAEARVRTFTDGWKLYESVDPEVFPDLARNALLLTVRLGNDPEEIVRLVRVEVLEGEDGRILLGRAYDLATPEQVVEMLKQGDIEQRHGMLFNDAVCFVSTLFEKE